MATNAQTLANQANAQLSTGARTPEGKAASSQNRRTHGFTGRFTILPWESQEEFDTLLADVRAEQNPESLTEQIYVDQMAQNLWLRQRALTLLDTVMSDHVPLVLENSKFALYLRYQTTAERNFDRCVNQLLKLRKEKRQIEIGFESQKRKEAAETARAAKSAAREEIAAIEQHCYEQMMGPLPDGAMPQGPKLRIGSSKEIAKMMRDLERKHAEEALEAA